MGPDGRIRVLWLVKGLGQGGMERLLVTHAHLGDHETFDYRAAHVVDRPHSVIRELDDLDVPTTRLGSGNAADPRWVRDLVRLVRRDRIDVVHAHSPMPASIARPVLTVTCHGVALVSTEHNRWDRYSTVTRWANRATFRFDDVSFAVSDDCRDTVPARLRGAVRTLVHGIDVDAVAAHRTDRAAMRSELGVDDDVVVVGTVANLRKQKNYPMLMGSARDLLRERSDVVFVAVGQGPLEADLRRLHDDLRLGDGFRFLGFRSDVHRVMSAFDVFCLASEHEGLPVALMEAKALGLPVVATAVGGIPEAVEDGVDGLLTAPGEAAALTAALRELADDAAARRRLGGAGRTGASDFGAVRAVTAQERAYRRLTDGRSSPSGRAATARPRD